VRTFDLSEPTSDDKLLGEITRYDHERGFGFVKCLDRDDLRDSFLHASAMILKSDIDDLEPGQRVTFEVMDSPRGPRAINVELVS
jgi:CspA family cold shock protein